MFQRLNMSEILPLFYFFQRHLSVDQQLRTGFILIFHQKREKISESKAQTFGTTFVAPTVKAQTLLWNLMYTVNISTKLSTTLPTSLKDIQSEDLILRRMVDLEDGTTFPLPVSFQPGWKTQVQILEWNFFQEKSRI